MQDFAEEKAPEEAGPKAQEGPAAPAVEGIGVVRARRMLASPDADPEAIAAILQEFPAEFDGVMKAVNEVRGNAFAADVMKAHGARQGKQSSKGGGDAPEGAPPKPKDIAQTAPENEPELMDREARWDKKKKEWVHAPELSYGQVKGKAFVDGVSPTDPVQGGVGDCWLVAGMSAVARVDPGAITSAISPAEGSGPWTVRLYARDGKGFKSVSYAVDNSFVKSKEGDNSALARSRSNATMDVEVEKWTNPEESLPIVSDPTRGEMEAERLGYKKYKDTEKKTDYHAFELWPAIMEKAFAIHMKTLHSGSAKEGKREGGYDDLAGDTSNIAFEALTGKPASNEGIDTPDIIGKMRKAVDAKQPVAAGTRGGSGGSDEKLKKLGGEKVYSNHAYSIVSMTETTIMLRNPWGEVYEDQDEEAHAERKARENWRGEVSVTIAEFKEAFDSVYIGNVKESTK